MSRTVLLLLALLLAGHAVAAPNGDDPRYQPCIERAAAAFSISPLLIKILLDVEGGKPGTQSRNTNGSHDLGPMQINDRVWMPSVERLGISREQVVGDACINIYVGAWIFVQEYQRTADIGLALAHYHSKTPRHQARYIGLVQRAVARRIERATLAAERANAALLASNP
jgi:soluble lytic murein transglycosylase-like protein